MTQILFADNSTLWETDGTPAGTHQVSTQPVVNPHFFNAGGRIFFTAGAVVSASYPFPPDQVWTTDGTSAGTQELASNLREPGLTPLGIGSTAGLNGTLYFAASDNGTH